MGTIGESGGKSVPLRPARRPQVVPTLFPRFSTALSTARARAPGPLPVALSDLSQRVDTLTAKLKAARAAFAEKAALFADDATVAGEFNQRVAAIDAQLKAPAPAAPTSGAAPRKAQSNS